MTLTEVLDQLALAGIRHYSCFVHGCPYEHRAMNRAAFHNHLRLAHYAPREEYACTFPGCDVSGRDPGMRVHMEAHHMA